MLVKGSNICLFVDLNVLEMWTIIGQRPLRVGSIWGSYGIKFRVLNFLGRNKWCFVSCRSTFRVLWAIQFSSLYYEPPALRWSQHFLPWRKWSSSESFGSFPKEMSYDILVCMDICYHTCFKWNSQHWK